MIPKKVKRSFESWPRKIIHIDMDAFFAAVEQRDHPELRGKPVIVGGDPQSRGVVSTASYEARKFGVHSAMASAQAKKLCPQGIFVRPNFERYSEASRAVMAILKQHTDLMEIVSVDEAYLDVTKHKLGIQDPIMAASLIKQTIQAVTHLTASAGVAPNFFLAKIASDFKKPDGLTVVAPEEIPTFLENLPVRKIPGVGPVTEKELHAAGFKTCGDLALAKKSSLMALFGKTGAFLYERAHGRDSREVEPDAPSKQYSTEETFAKDIKDKLFLKSKLKEIAGEVFWGLKREGRMGRTITLKVKYYDFELITRSKTLPIAPDSVKAICDTVFELLDGKTQAGSKAIRLVGVGISGFELPRKEKNSFQKELF